MNKRSISIRWKLVSTYLLLVLISLLLINAFINASLIRNLMDEKQRNLISQGTIVADQLAPSMVAMGAQEAFDYMETIVKGLSLRLESRVVVVDKAGEVLIDAYDELGGKNRGKIHEIDSALNGISSAQAYQFKDVGKVIYAGMPIYNGSEVIGALFISSSPEEIFNRVDGISGSFFRLSLGVIFITAVVSIIFADIVASPILSLTHVVKDVTSQNKRQQAPVFSYDELGELAMSFNEMMDKINKIDDMRRQFVSNVSHELRTPIASMKIIAETLIHSKPDRMEIYDDFMHDMNSELDRLNKIIETLLTLVNLEREGLELEYAQIIVNQLIEKTISTLKPLAEQKGIALTLKPHHNVFCPLDGHKMQQCLINIISNGIRYTPEGGRVTVSLEEEKDDVIIRISDTGIGIPKEDIKRIFERFYRVDSARARDTGGSGLGLSISHQIVALHQGRIEVESELGTGTTFKLTIPKNTGEGVVS